MKKTISFILLYCIILSDVSGKVDVSQKLKAVLIVGYQEDLTKNAIKDMDKIAKLLENNGVFVFKFYNKDAIWDNIIIAAKECHFFIYSGHGSKSGKNGSVGGICVDSTISTSKLMSTLELKDDALVVLKSVCYATGSSANDNIEICIKKAKERVYNYAYPFFKIGASAYYANNFRGGVYCFLNDFLNGNSLKKSYVNSTEIFTNIEFEEAFPNEDVMLYSIASSPNEGDAIRTTYINGIEKVERVKSHKKYDIVYVGYSDFSLNNMK